MPSPIEINVVLSSLDQLQVRYRARLLKLVERYSQKLEGRAVDKVRQDLKKDGYAN